MEETDNSYHYVIINKEYRDLHKILYRLRLGYYMIKSIF